MARRPSEGPFGAAGVLDAAADDSDKTIAVPGDERWEPSALRINLVATATVGTRSVDFQILDEAGNVYFQLLALFTATASQTVVHQISFGAGPGGAGNTTVPAMVLPPGFQIRVRDSAAIAPTADDLTLSLLVDKRLHDALARIA